MFKEYSSADKWGELFLVASVSEAAIKATEKVATAFASACDAGEPLAACFVLCYRTAPCSRSCMLIYAGRKPCTTMAMFRLHMQAFRTMAAAKHECVCACDTPCAGPQQPILRLLH